MKELYSVVEMLKSLADHKQVIKIIFSVKYGMLVWRRGHKACKCKGIYVWKNEVFYYVNFRIVRGIKQASTNRTKGVMPDNGAALKVFPNSNQPLTVFNHLCLFSFYEMVYVQIISPLP